MRAFRSAPRLPMNVANVHTPPFVRQSEQGNCMKKLSGIIVLLLAGAALYLALKTSPIDPLAWDAPAAPQMTGVLEPNDTLMKAELLGQGQLHGPEDTAVDSQGRVYAGLADGRVVRLDAWTPAARSRPSSTPAAGRWAWTSMPPAT